MPKHLITILLFSLLSQFASANKIDSLKTDQDVINFMANLGGNPEENRERFKKFIHPVFEIIKEFKKCEANVDTAALHTWIKLDVNKDGLTDLLINGIVGDARVPLLIMDNADGHFKFLSINNTNSIYQTNCVYVTVLNTEDQPLILFHSNYSPSNDAPRERKRSLYVDTLIYKFGNLIEYNSKPEYAAIEWVKLQNEARGQILFTMSFDKVGRSNCRKIKDNLQEGKFKGTIKPDAIQEILSLLDYIDVGKMKNAYSADWTDGISMTLTVRFSDGTVKKIKDYGSIGTFGLRGLYALIHKLTDSQEWEETD